ncbi:hypothetical protein AVEN_72301-1 [Araneus ventricosus]|uniref:Uncharacterized protein n=1 Tax=Araneus ventricosus TaxID=182803 RepID=A0A4Y2A4F3_ARAVE|nr:hypothetical protein AVEN_72301-1 [Araneus ventricosus]
MNAIESASLLSKFADLQQLPVFGSHFTLYVAVMTTFMRYLTIDGDVKSSLIRGCNVEYLLITGRLLSDLEWENIRILQCGKTFRGLLVRSRLNKRRVPCPQADSGVSCVYRLYVYLVYAKSDVGTVPRCVAEVCKRGCRLIRRPRRLITAINY